MKRVHMCIIGLVLALLVAMFFFRRREMYPGGQSLDGPSADVSNEVKTGNFGVGLVSEETSSVDVKTGPVSDVSSATFSDSNFSPMYDMTPTTSPRIMPPTPRRMPTTPPRMPTMPRIPRATAVAVGVAAATPLKPGSAVAVINNPGNYNCSFDGKGGFTCNRVSNILSQ